MANPSTKIKVSAEVTQALGALEQLQKQSYKLGTELESFGRRTGQVFNPLMTSVVALGAALATAGAAVTAFATGAAKDLNDAYSSIQRLTGATGPALDGLKDTFKSVASSADESFGEVATVVSNLNTRLGVSGKALETIASQILDAADMTGEAADEIVTSYTRMAGDWNVPVEKATATLDKMFVASQKTGIKISQLASAMTQYGAPMRQLGFDLETAIALMSKWEREGVNMELVLGSLRIALGKMAKDGVTDTVSELNRVVEAIKNAGTTGEANALALETFGARAGADMAAAVREGRFEVQDLVTAMKAAEGAIARTAAETQTWEESLGALRNRIGLALEPLGQFVRDGLNSIRDLVGVFIEWGEATQIVEQSVKAFAEGLGLAIPNADSLRAALAQIDVKQIVEWFRDMGETVKAVANGFLELANAVPWKTILSNLKDIAYVIFTVWAVEKAALLTGALLKMADAWSKFGVAVDGASIATKGLALGPLALILTSIGGMIVQFTTEMGDYTKAVKGADEAIEKMNLTQLKAAEDMAKKKIIEVTTRYEGNLSQPPEAKKWEAELARIQAAIKKVESQSKDTGDSMAEDMEKLEAFYKSLNGNIEQVAETAATIAPQVQKSFGEKVTDAVQGSIQELVAGINELRTQSKDLVTTFGIDAAAAGENLKSEIKKRATEASDKLVKDFDNPALKTLFGQALARLGKAGGDAMLTELGKSLAGAEQKISDFQKKLDEFNKQKADLDKQVAEGEASILATGPDSTTYRKKTGMKYEAPKKGSYEDYFNEATWSEPITLTKPIQEVMKSLEDKSLGGGLDAFIQKLSKGLESFDASKITAPIQQALTGIEASGETSGGAAGNKFGAAFVSNAKAAVDQVVEAINGIPGVVQVTIQKKTAGGTGGLAGQVAAAARG